MTRMANLTQLSRRPPAVLFAGFLLAGLALAACAPPPALPRGISVAEAAPSSPDQAATHAVETIEAALQATAEATIQPTSTVTPTLATPLSQAEGLQANLPVTPTAQPTVMVGILILVTPTPEESAAPNEPIETATPDAAATATAETGRLATAIAATLTAQPTPTPNLDATATAETVRLVIAIAAILTAQPTPTWTATPTPLPTATPDLAATATAETHRLETAVAATLTAQPTATATPTTTPTDTATPDLAATATAETQRLETAVAATLTAQPTATATPTVIPTETPTATPDFEPYLLNYRQAERAALQTLNPNVVEQLPVFAQGEALTDLKQRVATLQAAGQYQILVVEMLHIEQVLHGPNTGILVFERHNRQTFLRAADGDRLVEQARTEVRVVYGLVFHDGRWKVDKVRVVEE